MVHPLTVATQGLLNSPLSVAAVRGRLRIPVVVALVDLPGGSSDKKRIMPVDPVLRAKLLREDEEILTIIIAAMEIIDP